jgi:anthranilate synthase/aminodeoxychorismate synthase-like glutamine amidotransferase
MRMRGDVLLVDNLDSFSFNLVDSFERLGCTVQVLRNTAGAERVVSLASEREALIVISPGPGSPDTAGSCLDVIRLAIGKVPLLGICLGQQAMVQQAGGKVVRAPEPVHGKAWPLEHDGAGPFAGLPSPIKVARYHSLCTPDVPPRFRVHAAIQGMAMAISDPEARQVGLQIHPESILTDRGDAMLANVLAQF